MIKVRRWTNDITSDIQPLNLYYIVYLSICFIYLVWNTESQTTMLDSNIIYSEASLQNGHNCLFKTNITIRFE